MQPGGGERRVKKDWRLDEAQRTGKGKGSKGGLDDDWTALKAP